MSNFLLFVYTSFHYVRFPPLYINSFQLCQVSCSIFYTSFLYVRFPLYINSFQVCQALHHMTSCFGTTAQYPIVAKFLSLLYMWTVFLVCPSFLGLLLLQFGLLCMLSLVGFSYKHTDSPAMRWKHIQIIVILLPSWTMNHILCEAAHCSPDRWVLIWKPQVACIMSWFTLASLCPGCFVAQQLVLVLVSN